MSVSTFLSLAIEFQFACIRQPVARVVCINAERTKRRANVAKIKFEKARRSAK